MSMFMKCRKTLFMFGGIIALLTLSAMSEAPTAQAAEGAVDYYVPGVYGNVGLANLPGPGFYYVNYTLYQNGNKDKAVRQGRLQIDIEDDIVANAFTPIYIFDYELFGAHPLVGAAMIYMGVSENIEVETGKTGSQNVNNFGFGDPTIVPFGLSWHMKDWSVLFYEAINVPIGEWDKDNGVNLGYNYWAFDTNLGATWNLPWGLATDWNLGWLYNTKNNDTNYKTGSALHLDYTLEYDVSKRWQVGFSGYVYRQIVGDSGSGALLGDFKGRAYGIGPTVQYIASEDPISAINFQWIHDYHAKNRLKNDTFVLMLAFGIGK